MDTIGTIIKESIKSILKCFNNDGNRYTFSNRWRCLRAEEAKTED